MERDKNGIHVPSTCTTRWTSNIRVLLLLLLLRFFDCFHSNKGYALTLDLVCEHAKLRSSNVATPVEEGSEYKNDHRPLYDNVNHDALLKHLIPRTLTQAAVSASCLISRVHRLPTSTCRRFCSRKINQYCAYTAYRCPAQLRYNST